MHNNPLVSVVIPCYNDKNYVVESVNSALNQSYENTEIIIVDDGSNEETKKVLSSIQHKKIKLITQENKGQSAARNVGINAATGEYILVLDSDDFLDPVFCEKAIKLFNERRNLTIVSCFAYLLYNDERKGIYKPSGGTVQNFLEGNCALGASMFIKADFSNVNGYDELMKDGYEDWEFFIRLLSNGGRAEILQEPLYYYRQRHDSTSLKANRKKYELLRYIYLKHHELYKNHFDLFVNLLFSKIESEEKEKLKNLERIEFKIGKAILKPLRFFKKWILRLKF